MANEKIVKTFSKSENMYRIPADDGLYYHNHYSNYADRKENGTRILMNILYKIDYCMLCFEADIQTTKTDKQVCIISGDIESFFTLHEIIRHIFVEKFQMFESSNRICKKCEEMVISTFNFVTTAYKTAVVINSHLDKLKLELGAVKNTNSINSIVLTLSNESSTCHYSKSEDKYIMTGANYGGMLDLKSDLTQHILGHKSQGETCIAGNLKQARCKGSLNSSDAPLKRTVVCDYIVHDNKKCFNLSYECKMCYKIFYSESSLQNHELLCNCICQSRNIKFEGSIPEDHLISCSQDMRAFFTEKCPASFERDIEEKSTNTCTLEYTCNICLFKSISLDKLAVHMMTHRDKKKPNKPSKKIPCKYCNRQFANVTLCKKHEIKHKHSDTKSIESPELCDCCGKTFSSAAALQKHRERHKATSTCHLCGITVKEVTFKSHLWRHKQIANDPDFVRKYKLKRKQKYKCADCKYTCNSSKYMESHTNRFHLKIKPYKCSVCTKTFSGPHLLDIHRATHENTAEFPCTQCDKVFLYHLGLKLHLRGVHTGDRPYSCTECAERFISSSLLSVHRRKVHRISTVECPICGNMFPGIPDARRHIKRIHWKGTGVFDIRDVEGLSLDEMEKFGDRRSSSYGKL